ALTHVRGCALCIPSPRGSGERVARAKRGPGEGQRARQTFSQLGAPSPLTRLAPSALATLSPQNCGERVQTEFAACALRSAACELRLSPSLRRDHVQPLALAFVFRTRLLAPEPDLHAVEIKIDHRRGVEREQLAQRQAADHGVAERLAQLRSRALTGRERNDPE